MQFDKADILYKFLYSYQIWGLKLGQNWAMQQDNDKIR